uniref:Protein tyrosine phosphatase n=1 Tax=Glyptapanteles flavicoxis TaxID=463051 RepID=B7S8H7_9HYME|nr:protein tyrosine phosphatase [Glyptapanteles flavicoxis]
MANYGFEKLTISDFVMKTKQLDFEDLISQEFENLQAVPLEGTVDNFLKEENSSKNRYFDVPCWDHSRVILSSQKPQVHNHSKRNSCSVVVTEKDSDSTYIHANFVDGFEDKNKYICCQGPMKNTAGDMWKLIWENDVRIIVSLTVMDSEDEICYDYWVAEKNFQMIFGRYAVQTVEMKVQPNFLITTFRIMDLTCEASRLITHYWYTDWPNNGSPADLEGFVTLLSTVNKEQHQLIESARYKNLPKPGPILVHCSAGVGRTGTFCAVDHALGQLKKEKTVSIQDSVIAVRNMRHSSVMTLKQYMFIYKVIEHKILGEYNENNLQ